MSELQLDFSLVDAPATEALGAALARSHAALARGSSVLYLQGDLGAGKTTCVRSLLRTFGIAGLIRSPTYTLVEMYRSGPLTCVHVDLYRLQGSTEVEDLGLRDYFDADCLLLVEWPERGGGALPAADLELRLLYQGDSREAHLAAKSPRGFDWLSLLATDTRLIAYVSNLT